MGPSSSGASLLVRKMAVGPSAPPMIPMDAACAGEKPKMGRSSCVTRKVAKMPICAAAPSRRLLGLAIRGPKSVMAPTPRNMRHGYTPALTPMYSMSNRPPCAMM